MKLWHVKWLSGFAGGVALGILAGHAFAADISADTLKLAPGVMKAPEGFETPAAAYVVANPTNVFNNHFYYDTKVTGELKRGEKVEALAKVKGYEWVLIGKNGTGIGYVPISMLAPENLYRS
jgi:hypothetical protein